MDIDYKKYEDNVRKVDSNYMRNVLKKYISYFKDRRRVLDIACGRGDFLSLAREIGINAIGIDNDPSLVKDATSRGLTVYRHDAFEFLEKNQEPFDGIFCSQFIEHLSPNDLMRLLNLMHRNLTDDGIVILTTPNPRSLIVHLQSFYKDFSHVRFYDLELIKFMMECAMFKVIDAGIDKDTAFQMPLMTPCTIENNFLLNKKEDVPDANLEIVQIPYQQRIDEISEFTDLRSSNGHLLKVINKDILSSSINGSYYAAADKLSPVRLKGIFNGLKYYIDRIVYSFISRYLSGIYNDMWQYNKVLVDQQSRLLTQQLQLIENQDRLLKNQEELLARQSLLIEQLHAKTTKLEKDDIILQQQINQCRKVFAFFEEQLKKENDTISTIIELLKTNEASYNKFITSIYEPHDIYVIGIKYANRH
ncbi:class I SAM-dependent methyltransferase [Methanocella conradii]|uniref:class I SAM-dependent methyltransferase n=1 Tax=Methanocella conradii TaxID=1175444 RepID=UPI00157C01FA|nr:class I SAM-dependent methyltransferase [Methanocella conradii]